MLWRLIWNLLKFFFYLLPVWVFYFLTWLLWPSTKQFRAFWHSPWACKFWLHTYPGVSNENGHFKCKFCGDIYVALDDGCFM